MENLTEPLPQAELSLFINGVKPVFSDFIRNAKPNENLSSSQIDVATQNLKLAREIANSHYECLQKPKQETQCD